MECQYLGDGLWNFILETSFTTPDDFTNLWDFGIVFRHSDSNNQYRLTLYPDTWTLDNWKGDSDKVDFIDSGNLDSIKPEANKTNQIRMVAANDKGYLFINNKFVTRLDLSARQSGNSIRICTGEMGASGNVIHINSVRLWELP
jgi:hypothetical protein